MGTFSLIIGVTLVVGGLAAAILSLLVSSSAATGAARSLELIHQRPVVRDVAKAELSARDRLLVPLLDSAKGIAIKLSPGGTTNRLGQSLERAGNPEAWTLERVYGAKGVGLFAGGALGLFFGGGLSMQGIIWGLVGVAAGFFLPDLLLYNAGAKRREQLRKGLADALDMLTVCVEAGQGFDSGLLQVARSIEGPIAGEFARLLSEVQIGKTRAEAFASLGERANTPEVKNFVSALVQADRLGLPIGNVLREQSVQMRVARRQRAEEKAQQVTVKIMIPMLLCIFPAVFIVIIGPGAIRMIDAFSGL